MTDQNEEDVFGRSLAKAMKATISSDALGDEFSSRVLAGVHSFRRRRSRRRRIGAAGVLAVLAGVSFAAVQTAIETLQSPPAVAVTEEAVSAGESGETVESTSEMPKEKDNMKLSAGTRNLLAASAAASAAMFTAPADEPPAVSEGGVKGLPANYYQVSYLKSQNGAYIDTGYCVDTATTEIELKMIVTTEMVLWSGYYYGVNDDATTKKFGHWGYTYNRYAYFQFGNWKTYKDALQTYKGAYAVDSCYSNKVWTFTYSGALSGTNTVDASSQANVALTNSLYVFALNDRGTASSVNTQFRLKRMKIFESGSLVHDLVPARLREDASECGLFDLVTRRFLRNANSVGSFAIGSDVLDDVPYEEEEEQQEEEKIGGPLFITATKGLYGAPSPAYGQIDGLEIGTNLTLTCPATIVTGDVHYACAGWKCYRTLDNVIWDLVEEGEGNSINYTHVKQGTKIEWQWRFAGANIRRGLPRIYQQVAYLQNADTAYIDTGYCIKTAKTQIELKMNVSTTVSGNSSSCLCGVQDEGDAKRQFYLKGYSWHTSLVLYSFGGPVYTTSFGAYNQWLSIDASYMDKVFVIDCTNLTTDATGTYTWDSKAADYTFDNTLWLFCHNGQGSAQNPDIFARIKRLWIIEENRVVCDFVPVRLRADSSVRGLYDLRRQAFFGNANSTGNFTVGADIKDVPYEKEGLSVIIR